MDRRDRREFLAEIGRGMLIAGLGYGTALDLELVPAFAGETSEPGAQPLRFGPREALVEFLQETPVEKLLPQLVAKLNSGTELKELVAAGALANARTFGGEDYVGFHTFMAMSPAWHMTAELPAERRALPVLKVLYRNSKRLHEQGGRKNEVLHSVVAPEGRPADAGERAREAVRKVDLVAAERALASADEADAAFNALLHVVEDGVDVHRIVLASRTYDMLSLVGREHAQAMLRQSIHYCVKEERRNGARIPEVRTLLPQLLDRHKLARRKAGTMAGSDAWIEDLSKTIFTAKPAEAAGAVAEALAAGFVPDDVGRAITLATNQLILRDAGRSGKQIQAGKPAGSVHGDSIGVHACDTTHAWRSMAAAADDRNRAACLILAGYQAALDRTERGGDFLNWQPRPTDEVLKKVSANDAESLLKQLDGAIRDNDQERACAVTARIGQLGYAPRPVFDLLLKYACSEEGALHAEKFYRTSSDGFADARAPHKWRHLIALARVTASEANQPAAGYAEACELLGV